MLRGLGMCGNQILLVELSLMNMKTMAYHDRIEIALLVGCIRVSFVNRRFVRGT